MNIMTQQIEELKKIAGEYGLVLFPITVLKSHCLFSGGSNRGRYEDAKLVTMPEQRFREICWKAANPPQASAEEMAVYRAAEIEHRKRSHSLVTGRF